MINDFRQSGSLAVLSSLLNYNNGALAPEFQHSLLAMRILVERETARLAAVNATLTRSKGCAGCCRMRSRLPGQMPRA